MFISAKLERVSPSQDFIEIHGIDEDIIRCQKFAYCRVVGHVFQVKLLPREKKIEPNVVAKIPPNIYNSIVDFPNDFSQPLDFYLFQDKNVEQLTQLNQVKILVRTCQPRLPTDQALKMIRNFFQQNKIPLNSGFMYFITNDQDQKQVKIHFHTKSLMVHEKDKIGLQDTKSGFLNDSTQFFVSAEEGVLMPDTTNLSVQDRVSNLIKISFESISDLGIGGLDEIFAEILKQIIATRTLLAEHQKLLNFNMCKGVILEGPPGTGKTLMARKLGLLLNAHVKIVRGPDILSQYVGNSAKKTRDLFAEAELDWNAYGNKSPLHIILIDEIDAICPKRSYDQGGEGAQVMDQVVATFLAMIDGITQINNMFVIGTTNNFKKIDQALLRSGRLEKVYQLGPPNLDGRKQIWKIHLSELICEKIVDPNIIEILAKITDNFTGAQIERIIRDTLLNARDFDVKICSKDTLVDYISQLEHNLKAGTFKIQFEHFEEIINQQQMGCFFGKEVFTYFGSKIKWTNFENDHQISTKFQSDKQFQQYFQKQSELLKRAYKGLKYSLPQNAKLLKQGAQFQAITGKETLLWWDLQGKKHEFIINLIQNETINLYWPIYPNEIESYLELVNSTANTIYWLQGNFQRVNQSQVQISVSVYQSMQIKFKASDNDNILLFTTRRQNAPQDLQDYQKLGEIGYTSMETILTMQKMIPDDQVKPKKQQPKVDLFANVQKYDM